MNLVRDAVGHFVGRIGETAIGFLTTIYIAHALGPAGIGKYALAVAIATWVTIPPASVARAVSKRMSEAGDGGYATAGAVLVGALSAVLAAVVFLFGSTVREYTGVATGYVAALVVAIGAYHLANNLYIGRSHVSYTGGIGTAERFVRFVATVLFVSLGYGVNGVVGAHALTIPIVWLLALLYHRDLIAPEIPAVGHATDLVAYSKHIWMDAVRARAFAWTDTLVLGVFVAPGLVGVYEVAWRISQAATTVASSIQRSVFPRISAADADALRGVRETVSDSLAYPGIFAIPALVGAAVLGPRVFLIYGEGFTVPGARTVLLLLVASALVMAFAQQYISALNAVNEHARAFRINSFLIVANVLLNVALVSTIGWVGAAVASLSVTVVTLLAANESVMVVMGRPKWPVQALKEQVLAAATMGVVVVGIARVIVVQSAPELLVVVGIGGVVYGGTLYSISSTLRETVDRVVPA